MKTAIIAATAALLIGGAGMASAQQTVIITKEQQPVIQKYVVEQRVAPAQLPSDYDVVVGGTMPDTVELHAIEAPDFTNENNYEYVVVGNRTVLVDPQTREVVQILE